MAATKTRKRMIATDGRDVYPPTEEKLLSIARLAIRYVQAVHDARLDRWVSSGVRDRRRQVRLNLIEAVDRLPRTFVDVIDRRR